MSQDRLDLLNDLRRLWCHIERLRKGQFAMLLALMILVSFAEILSISAVLPFLAVLTAPERLFEHALAQPLIRALELREPEGLLLPLTLAFVAAALLVGLLRLLLLWTSARVSFATGADLSVDIYRRTLYQPYSVHISRNSSEVIAGIVAKTDTVTSIIALTLSFLSSCIMLFAIMATLLSIDPRIAISAFTVFGLMYGVIGKIAHTKLLADSRRVAREANQVVKALQEGLGGIRDVLLYGSQATCCHTFQNADLPLRRARGNTVIIGASPRYLMEALGMAVIAFLAFTLMQRSDGLSTVIPVMGALALGAQRLLPALQHAYGAWSGIQGGRTALSDTLSLLDQPLPEHAIMPTAPAMPFTREIKLESVSFRYSDELPPVFEKVSLSIPRGSRVGFIGVTGSGKSTLLDIVMGLLPPSSGHLAIDGKVVGPANFRSWQAHIAHVAQDIYLSDSSIAENIAFGEAKDKIDLERVREAARLAQIDEFVEGLPAQYQTVVGERGVRLSGGQRQRIGIARAFYRNADVIIFDEATSALDSETEQAVMQSIDMLGKDLTVLTIAHRISTLRNCTQIVELDMGGRFRLVGYEEITGQAA